MNWLTRSLSSSIGNKLLVAITGIGLVGFLVGHLAGNLQVYLGQDAFNAYATGLRELGPLLNILRAGIVLVAIVHVVTAIKAARSSKNARPVAYAKHTRVVSSGNSHSMVRTGLLILAFVLFHLAHFTWGLTHPEHYKLVDGEGRHDAYSMLVLGFQSWPVAVSYVVAMFLLGMHISHGIPSLLQTLGISHPKYRPLLEKSGPVIAVLLVAGFVSIPVSVLLGIVPLPEGVL